MIKLLSSLCFVILITSAFAQLDIKVYAQEKNGAEVININAAPIALAFASNLQMDQSLSADLNQTIFFTADRGSPNLYTAQFKVTGGEHSFWSTGKSPLQGSFAAPFLSFDVYKNNFIGPSFPNNLTLGSYPSFSIQRAYLSPQGVITEQLSTYLDNTMYTFVSSHIDPQTDNQTGTNFVYLAGWASTNVDPFVVARAKVTLNSTVPSLTLDKQDILSVPMAYHCYDQFDEIKRPYMNLTSKFLLVIVPGRCGLFTKIPLPNPGTNFGSIPQNIILKYDPLGGSSVEKYLSSAIFDHDLSVIYFTTKTYNTPGAYLQSFVVSDWILNSGFKNLDLQESETLLVLGNEYKSDKVLKYIFVIASGSTKIERFEVNDDYTYTSLSTAVLTPDINKISSAYFYYPYLYFTTNEPDAKIVRISKTNFCASPCGDNGYCDQGVCKCQVGYVKDVTNPNTPCKLTDIVNSEIGERESRGAAAALGVLFAFSFIAAVIGWFLWWKKRNYTPLVGRQ